jgi:hypothetical protein
MQSVSTTTKPVNSNPAHFEVYYIHHYVRKFINRFLRVLRFPPPLKLTAMIYTHYIHSVVVQDLYQVEPVVWTSITTSHDSDELWCGLYTQQARPDTVLYQHTMYVISLSNMSIKANFKQITRFEIRLTNVYNTLGETTFCAWRHVICCSSFFCFAYHVCCLQWRVSPYSNDLTSWKHSSSEKISCSVAPFFYYHIRHLVSDTLYQTGYFL